MLRTTCVATMVNAGHAPNALPQRAQANVNCRILPGVSVESVRDTLVKVLADSQVHVTAVEEPGAPSAPPPLTPQIMDPVRKLGDHLAGARRSCRRCRPAATDGRFLNAAGIPTYGLSGLFPRRGRQPRPRPERTHPREVADGRPRLSARDREDRQESEQLGEIRRIRAAAARRRALATYALIPGGGGDPWEWHRLVPELASRGHDAIAVRLPAEDDKAGWSEYADTVVDAIGDRADVILVAASMGGFTAPIVCTRRRVDLLVLLNAMIPMPGETFNAWGTNTGSGPARREYHASLGLSPAEADDDAVIYYHDLPSELRAEAQARTWQDQSMTPLDEPWPLAFWPDVPTRVLAGRHDRMFPLDFQRRVARERLAIEVDEIDGGHMVAMSNPAELANRLEAYRLAVHGKGPVAGR